MPIRWTAAPAQASTSRNRAPCGTSTTPGFGTAPPMVTSAVPGSVAVPTAANQSGPNRAIKASCASVSALSTRVGRPSTPRSQIGSSLPAGRASPLFRNRTRAVASDAMYRPGRPTTSMVEPTAGTLGQRPRKVAVRGRVGMHRQHDPIGPDRHGRRHRAVDDQVRRPGDQHLVLQRRRITLAAVGHHDGGQPRRGDRCGDRAHFSTGRETGAAAAEHAGGVQALTQLVDADRGQRTEPCTVIVPVGHRPDRQQSIGCHRVRSPCCVMSGRWPLLGHGRHRTSPLVVGGWITRAARRATVSGCRSGRTR